MAAELEEDAVRVQLQLQVVCSVLHVQEVREGVRGGTFRGTCSGGQGGVFRDWVLPEECEEGCNTYAYVIPK